MQQMRKDFNELIDDFTSDKSIKDTLSRKRYKSIGVLLLLIAVVLTLGAVFESLFD